MKKQLPTTITVSTAVSGISSNTSSTAGAAGLVKRFVQAVVALVTLFVGVAGVLSPAGSVAAAGSAGPVRVVDTRVASKPTVIDGRARAARPVFGGETITIQVGSDPVVLNTVAVLPTGAGFATVFPCADGLPNASNLNFVPNSIIANSAIATPDANGEVCIYFEIVGGVNGVNKADVVVDQYSTINAAEFNGQRPVRLFDSRDHNTAPRPAGSVSRVHVGVADRPVVLNVTTTGSNAGGIFTVFPCGQAVPNTSNLNYEAAETRAAMAVVKTNSAGDLCIFTSSASHVIADWSGTFTGGSDAQEFFTPTRLMDTRDHFGGKPGQDFLLNLTDYRSQSGQPIAANGRAVMLNVTAVGPNSDGFITVYPCGNGARPTASILNYPTSRFATANSVLVQPDSMNRVCFYSDSPTQLVVDLFGFVAPTTEPVVADPAQPNPPNAVRLPINSSLECHPIADGQQVTNQWRAARGAAPLNINPALYAGAEWWAQQLVLNQEFRHSTKEEVAGAGHVRRLGEVVSMRDTITAWQHSAPHYEIIVDARYTQAAFAFCSMEHSDGSVTNIGVGWFDF